MLKAGGGRLIRVCRAEVSYAVGSFPWGGVKPAEPAQAALGSPAEIKFGLVWQSSAGPKKENLHKAPKVLRDRGQNDQKWLKKTTGVVCTCPFQVVEVHFSLCTWKQRTKWQEVSKNFPTNSMWRQPPPWSRSPKNQLSLA